MEKLKTVYMTIGNGLFGFDTKIDIQKLENGFVFHGKYYQTVENIMPDLQKALENYFG